MKTIFLFLAIAILSLSFAAAYPLTIHLNSNMPFNTAIYHCSDASCSNLGSLYASDSGNTAEYTINNEGSGTQYFAEYDYNSDRCYVSHSYKNWFDESTGNGPWQSSVNFAKQNDCKAKINSVSFTQQIYDNQTQQITINVKSPLNINPSGPQIIPTNLEFYYSTNIEAVLEVKDQTSIIYSETKNIDILWSNSKEIAFALPLLQAGTYSITLKTRVNDCMCSSYIEQSEEGNFVVLQQPVQQNQTNQTQNQAPFADFTYSQKNPIINQIVTFDASSSYDSDGNITSYNWNFGDGASATGVNAQHSFATSGDYSVALTVKDNKNAETAIIRIIPVSAQQQNQTNQTNQTNPSPPQPSTSTTPKSTNHTKSVSTSVNNVNLQEVLAANKGSCNEKTKIIIGLKNSGERLKDVYVNFKIPETGLSIDSEEFDISKYETKYLEFEFIPENGGILQSIISVYYKDTNKRILQDISIKCKETVLTQTISGGSKELIQITSANPEAGITGNVIAITKKNASAGSILAVFLILVLISFIARAIFIKKQ